MKQILPKDVKYEVKSSYDPVASIDPEEKLKVKTLDNQAGRIKSEEDFGSSNIDDVNPLTGPISIETAEPGDVLAVEVEEIDIAPKGHMQLIEGYGLLKEEVQSPRTKIVPIEDEKAVFSSDLQLDISPMIGSIAVAPAEGSMLSVLAGPTGGNLDNKDIKKGATVYLPIEVEGADLFLGDVHALMGDGELCLTGIEIAAHVTISCSVIKDWDIPRPMVETDRFWETNCYSSPLENAIETASIDMAHFLSKRLQVNLGEAVLLMSAVADVRISQAAPNAAQDAGASVRVKFPRKYDLRTNNKASCSAPDCN